MAITLSQINSNMDGLGLKKKKGLEADLLKGMSDKNLEGVQSALRGAQVHADATDQPPPGRIEDAKALDPAKPEDEKPKSNDKQQLLYQALIAAVPTLIGAAVGGNEGGAIGAKVGGDAIAKMETDKKEGQKLAFERSIKVGELAEKKRGRDFDEKKLAQEKELKEKEIASNHGLKALEKQIAGTKDKRDAEFNLQKTWDSNPSVVNYTKALEGISKIRKAGEETAGGNQYDDTALIFNFMKVLDPGSVVREGEYKTAANNAGLLERFGVSWQKVQNGQSLTPDQRTKLIEAAEKQYMGHEQVYNDYSNNIAAIANRNGLNPANVVVGFGQGIPKRVAATPPPAGGKKGGIKEAQAAVPPAPPAGYVHVVNSKTGEEHFIPEADVAEAKKEGFQVQAAKKPEAKAPAMRSMR